MKTVYSYYRHRGLVFVRDLINLDDWATEKQKIQDAEDRLQKDIQTYITRQSTSHLKQLAHHAYDQEKQQLSDKDEQCRKHLRLTDPRHDKARIERTKGGLLLDLYRWVLENQEFKRWRDQPESRLLWTNGDPGKGKTMLLCGIINELERGISGDASHCNVAYFFCQATDSRISNATAVLRGLIYLLTD
ncbi:hypothetical protein VTG60DRAFT_3456 [Thermothelomyces hinnuleus]